MRLHGVRWARCVRWPCVRWVVWCNAGRARRWRRGGARRRGRRGRGAGAGARERGQRTHGVPHGARARARVAPADHTAAAAGTTLFFFLRSIV